MDNILRAADAPPQSSEPIGEIRASELSETQRALLTIIHDLQRRTGWCYASKRYLAASLAAVLDLDEPLTDRHLRRVMSQLRAADCVALLERRGKPTLVRALKLPVSAGGPDARPRTYRTGGPRTSGTAAGRTSGTAYKNISDREISGSRRKSSEKNSEEGGLFEPRRYFNPLRAEHRRQQNGTVDYDNRPPQQRVCDAKRNGLIVFALWRDRERLIVSARWGVSDLFLELADDQDPGAAPEAVKIPSIQVGGLKLWR